MSSHSGSSKNATTSQDVVIEYLRKKGMGGAVLALKKDNDDQTSFSPRQTLERMDDHYRNQRSILSKLTGGGMGYDRDTAWPVVQWGMPEIQSDSPVLHIGQDEATMYVDSFVAIQLKVLALQSSNVIDAVDDDYFDKALELIKTKKDIEAARVVEEVDQGPVQDSNTTSEKHELTAVVFALLTHTYCELLEVGMEKAAHNLRDTFRPVYTPIYGEEYKDFDACNSTESLMRLNMHVNQHLDSLSNQKQILAKVRQQELFGQELRSQSASGKPQDPQQIKAVEQKIIDLKQKYMEYSQKAAIAFSKKHEFPFLRRARGARWQLTLSIQSFSVLQRICDTPMSSILQARCELHVERRDPFPMMPNFLRPQTSYGALDPTQLIWDSRAMNSFVPADPKHTSMEAILLRTGSEDAHRNKRDASGLSSNDSNEESKRPHICSSALEPSILVTALVESSKGPFLQKRRSDSSSTDVATIWDEKGVSICCMRMSPPDGDRIAAGCDDSLVRIWSRHTSEVQVLPGHQNSFPVFALDWNSDSRFLLSSGGDGVVRLWDTFASSTVGTAWADENNDEAERAVFRGHAPGSSVWSVAFSPIGYYFVSTGSDSSARVWTTDRLTPVRLLAGHSSSNVNSVAWHPNANYILTGADDKSARLWDVQTGRTVRLLDGCHDAIHCVDMSPDGRYAALADRSGTISMWDLGSGKMMAELKAKEKARKNFMVNALRFSSCGEALASSGDDCSIRLWDVRSTAIGQPGFLKPTKSYSTKHTLIMDLRFTPRNLLFAVGKSVTPIPKCAVS